MSEFGYSYLKFESSKKIVHFTLNLLLHQVGVDLEQEGDTAGSLGMRIEWNKSALLEMK